MIVDFVGHVSNKFLSIPNTCYNDNKTQIMKIHRYFITDNQDIITSTIIKYNAHVKVHSITNFMLYAREYGNFESTYIDYEFEISLELVNMNIIQYI